jgi:hypothetical protein
MTTKAVNYGTPHKAVADFGKHKTLWEVSGVKTHIAGHKSNHKDVLDLGWAASKVDAAKAFIHKHMAGAKQVKVTNVFRLK